MRGQASRLQLGGLNNVRNMSFMLTTEQVRARTKTVTRRTGWKTLKAGEVLCAVKKGMGLKKGEKIERLATIRVLSVRSEPLARLTTDVDYGFEECAKEGFAHDPRLRRPSEFVEFFCRSHKGCEPASLVQRIEFEYVDTKGARDK